MHKFYCTALKFLLKKTKAVVLKLNLLNSFIHGSLTIKIHISMKNTIDISKLLHKKWKHLPNILKVRCGI